MQKPNLITEPVLIGDHHGLFGHLTLPTASASDVGVIFLNAGMLHDVGPFRLYVDIARELASRGFGSLRLDQSGKGESVARRGVTQHETLKLDFQDCMKLLGKRGINRVVLVGLCSGADDSVEICTEVDGIAGMVFLDGYAKKTKQFHLNRLKAKLGNGKDFFGKVTRVFSRTLTRGRSSSSDLDAEINSRTWSSDEEMIDKLQKYLARGGRILAVFTSGQRYYNYEGQLAEAIGDTPGACGLQEVYFSDADHTFTAVKHRARTVHAVCDWIESACLCD